MSDTSSTSSEVNNLLEVFRQYFNQFTQTVQQISVNTVDSVVLARLGDDLNEYMSLVEQYSGIFQADELGILQTSLSVMREDVRQFYSEALDSSHHGRPVVVQQVYTGQRGRPAIHIDPDFLRWAYSLRSTASIARFLGVNRSTVRNALLEHGLAAPQSNPFGRFDSDDSLLENGDIVDESSLSEDAQIAGTSIHNLDDLLDPQLPAPAHFPTDIQPLSLQGSAQWQLQSETVSFTGPLSNILDIQLDDIIRRLRSHYIRAGLAMLDGMLRRLGYRVPRERIRQSLLRIDPVQRIFDRIQIRRRVYTVPGPNALWHHDGQHGLIRWGIIIHGFIDGYSRLITGLQASNNNCGQTVLELFLRASASYGVPSRVRGDHGVENILLAAWMEEHCGVRRGSYIWGRSVHNVRIERLWVDITAQIGGMWADFFTTLELQHGLDINNTHHIWLLHFLFLATINEQLSFFAESWNQHRIQIRGAPNRSPADMFGFDMLVHGVRGSQLPEVEMPDEELEVYGVDWAALRDDQVLTSLRSRVQNDQGSTSWVGRVGPSDHLNEVRVDPPEVTIEDAQLNVLRSSIENWMAQAGDSLSVSALWIHGLAFARLIYVNDFELDD